MCKATITFILATCFTIALPAHAGGISNELLLSSAWCSFSNNKVTGYSNTTRVRFSKNGTYSTGGPAEGSTSSKSGAFASQKESRSNGRWKSAKGELGLVRTVVKRNSSGYPIIVADGAEYSQYRLIYYE
jgi:hypothetical protein